MASALPIRLLAYIEGNFFIIDTRSQGFTGEYDIVSYTWGKGVAPYNCGINGVTWPIKLAPEKMEDLKRLMVTAKIQYLWADCVCINQTDENEKAEEVPKMNQYYKNAGKCHILMDMVEVWNPQDIVENLKFLNHILLHMGGASLASEAIALTPNMTERLAGWANARWAFPVDETTVRSAAIDKGVLNCYSTCIEHVRSLFDNAYFTRVWTFQEMVLGKNITMWGINRQSIAYIGQLQTWMDLATDAKDKAFKLQAWIEASRVLKTESVKAILRIIEEDNLTLASLQIQVLGITSARSDIINGGPSWWHENYKGISNIFSAVSITPRECTEKQDVFRGLLGIFSGLFTAEEVKRELSGDDMDKISFAFFKQLSIKTGYAWTRLAISSKERKEFDWIPVLEASNKTMTTDSFAGVVNLGRLGKSGQAKAYGTTGIIGKPQKYMQIKLTHEETGKFRFVFKGCNCGKEVKTGMFKKEPIPNNVQPRDIVKDETGRTLVYCATILGSLMDPGGNVVEYRRRLLNKLRPHWTVTDPIAKPTGWIDRCVSGSLWENPHQTDFRPHNMSMNYNMVDIIECETRLENESTVNLSCHVTVNCGCTIIAPFSMIFGAITAVEGSTLGDTTGTQDEQGRISLQDGLGLVQVGDVGRSFSLVAFGGDVNAHRSYASGCKSTKLNNLVVPKLPWPSGRALVRSEFQHELTDMMRDYGYVQTGGSGNLLICRNNLIDQYRIIGVCIDKYMNNKGGDRTVNVR